MADIFDSPGTPPVSSAPPTSPAPAPPPAAAPPPSTAGPAAGEVSSHPPEPTKENLANLQDLLGDFIDGKKLDSKPTAKPAPDKGSRAAAKPKVTPKPTPAPVTAKEIAEATAEAVARALKPATPTAPATPQGPDLDADDKATEKVLKAMEQASPDKYKGVSGRFRAAQLKSYDYQDKWEASHPGEDFDPDSPEHEDFRKSVEVPWEPSDFDDAKIDMRVQERLAEKGKDIDAKLSQYDRTERLRAASPTIAQHVGASRKSFWATMGDDYKDVVADNGAINPERLRALMESDPVTTGHRIEAARALDAEVPEIYKLLEGLSDVAKPNDPMFPVHQAINEFGFHVEQTIAEQPPENQLDAHGRPFLPTSRFYALSKAEQARYWTLTPEHLVPLRAKHWADKAADAVVVEERRLSQWAKSRGINVPSKHASAPINAGTTPPPSDDDEPGGKPQSPSTGALPNQAARQMANHSGHEDRIVSGLFKDF